MANDQNNDFENNRLYKVSQNISWFFIMTLWFVINFIPLLFFFLFVDPSLDNIVWYLIGIIPLGPAIGGLIGATLHVIEEDDFSEPGKDFRKYYKQNFFDTLKIWVPYLFLMYLISVNINYYLNIASSEYFLLAYIFMFLALFLTLYLVPIFLIQMKFSFRYRDLLKLGLYYLFLRLKLTFGNLFIIFIVIFLIFVISELILLAIPAILSYLWVLYNYSIVKDVKDQFIKEEE